VLNLGLSPIAGAVDQALGTNTRDWWFENMMLERAARKVTPNPREVGVAGPDPAFALRCRRPGGHARARRRARAKTVGKSIEGVEQGLDVGTAMQKGAIEGGGAALGVALPIAMPYMVGSRIPGLVQQIGYGVGGERAARHREPRGSRTRCSRTPATATWPSSTRRSTRPGS
jgi:hypothetical protein